MLFGDIVKKDYPVELVMKDVDTQKKIFAITCRSREDLLDKYGDCVIHTVGRKVIEVWKDDRMLYQVGLRPKEKTKGETDTNYDLTDDGTGKKYDGGKPMVGTLCRVFPHALLAVGQCIEFGTHKYPQPDNWSLVPDGFNRYSNSLMRHLLKIFAGQATDPETNLPHIYHVCWNALAMAEFYIKDHPELDKELFK